MTHYRNFFLGFENRAIASVSLLRDTAKRFSSGAFPAVCHSPAGHNLRRFVSLTADYMIVFLTAIFALTNTDESYLFEHRA
jgi:hypothetical protein